MNFSQCLKHGGICQYSPNYSFIALSKGSELYIYDAIQLSLLLQYTFNESYNYIEWSSDSLVILVGIFKKSYCELKSLSKPEHNCRIDEGIAGMLSIHWTPDGRKLYSVCDCNIKLTIWSLVDKSIAYINNPKYAEKGISFSSNSLFMALAERKEWHDFIGIYYTKDWTLIQHFMTETVDLQDILWLKDNTAIIITDYSIEGKVYVYSPEGKIIAAIMPFENIKAISLIMIKVSLNNRMIAFYLNDNNTIMIYDTIVWKYVMTINHKGLDTQDIKILKEEEVLENQQHITKYTEYKNVSINSLLKGIINNNQEVLFEFSNDSKFLAYRNCSYPNIAWIWDLNKGELYTLLIHSKTIKDFKWSPTDNTLILLTENSLKVYIYSLSNSFIADISFYKEGILPNRIFWNSNGKHILLNEKSSMVIGNLHKEDFSQQFDYNSFI